MVDDLPPYLRSRITPPTTADGCWLWTGSVHPAGYGQIEIRGSGRRTAWLAHRLVWRTVHPTDVLPENLHHRCQVKLCVRPDHLVPMTTADHVVHHNTQEATCAFGHPWTEENTYRPARGGRQCRACKATRQRRAYAADPASHVAASVDRRRRARLT